MYGVEAHQIVDYLCLVGDSADNVPGIKGCGPKTALKLLEQYGTLESIFHNRKHIKGAVGKTINAQDHIPFEILRQVITVDTDVYKRGDPRLDTSTMKIANIRNHIEENESEITALKESIGIEGLLIAELGL